VHLLRPIGAQQKKQKGQRKAIGVWAQGLLTQESGATVVILGDTKTAAESRSTALETMLASSMAMRPRI
jgi:surface antigen